MLFWKSQPEFDLEFPDSKREDLVVIRLIRQRWEAGGYHRSELAFDRETEAWPVDFDKLNRMFGGRVEAELPSSMRISLHGRKLTSNGCIDGIPARFWPESLR